MEALGKILRNSIPDILVQPKNISNCHHSHDIKFQVLIHVCVCVLVELKTTNTTIKYIIFRAGSKFNRLEQHSASKRHELTLT